MNFLRYILMTFLLLLGFESQAARYALVIGNADYRAVASLHNPKADAEDMATVLGNLKFQVTPLINASKREMDETLGNFYEQVKQQNAAHEVIVYFSGHGLQHEGANYLMPIDASPKQRADIQYMTVNAQQILDNLHEINGSGVNLLILDACRNVPTQLKSVVKGGNEGLVGMRPSGSLVLYATTPGKTALGHGEWRNSIYTHYLLEALRDRTKQSLSIFDVQTFVAAAVSKKTQQQQFPWHEGTLTQAFCFLPPCGVPQKDENLLSEMARLRAENALLKQKPPQVEQQLSKPPVEVVNKPQVSVPRQTSEMERLRAENALLKQKPRVAAPSTTEVEHLRQPVQQLQQSSKPPVEVVNKPPVSRKSFEPEMVLIPAGTFNMGSNTYNWGSDEKPVHTWKMGAFRMSKYETTFDEYDAFASETGRSEPSDKGWGRGKRPVINVSWQDAVAYAEWLSGKTGKTYRLPTEAEWEYAARAGTTTKYWWGDHIGSNEANCMRCGNGTEWSFKQTAPVGSFSPNGFGLYDTVGNVREWTCSEYGDYSEGNQNKCNQSVTGLRVVRGGSLIDEAPNVRSASRISYDTALRDLSIGFRLISP